MAKLKLNSTKPTNKTNSYDIQQFTKKRFSIEELLIYCTESDCSDLYIKVGSRPYISRFGKVVELPTLPTTNTEWHQFYDLYIKEEFNAKYVRRKMFDTAVEVRIPEDSKYYGRYPKNRFRYRLSLGFSEKQNIATFRMIRPENPTFRTINYPKQCEWALEESFKRANTLNVLSAATGQGKTTTLVSCFNTFTQPGGVLDNKVIITLEDPIEYTFSSTPSVKFNQKELGNDFISYKDGIIQALREHPNIINVGECRDTEVISAAIEAARTGHAVTTTFHADTVGGTISRLLYHLNNDINMAYDLIINLGIIMCQRLLKRDDRYQVDTQYILFNSYITKKILDAVDGGKNIQVTVNELFSEKELIENKFIKDWSY